MVAQDSNSKKVVEEVSGWLRIFSDGSVNRTWTGPPSALPLMDSIPPYSTPIDNLTLHDIPGNPDLRVYLPESPTKRLPILLHFQGGGFCISHPSWMIYHQFYSRLARSVPAIIVSVVLPLAPEHPLPAAIDVSHCALISLPDIPLLQPAADFERIFLIGDSSGGNIVHAVAAREATRIAGGVMLNPGFVRATRSRSEIELKSDSAFLTLDMLDKFLALSLPEGATKDHPITCPMGEAAPPLESLRLPPMMVAVAENDLIRDTNYEYCEAMKKAGKEVEVVVSKGVSHSFHLNKFAVELDANIGKRTTELIDAIKSFVERH